MRAFVTGGSGFVGSHLIRALVARGWEVVGLALTPAHGDAVAQCGAEAIVGDLNNQAALCAGMHACDLAFHLAAVVDPFADFKELRAVNVDGTRHLLEAARTVRLPRLIFASAAAVLANGAPVYNADESHPVPLPSLRGYCRSKAIAERVVLRANGPDLQTLAVRLPAVWGQGDTAFIKQLLERVRTRQFVWIDHGRYPYSTCHVRNACEGMLRAAEHGSAGASYFLTDGSPIEFREFVTGILATQDVAPPRGSVPRWLAWTVATLIEGTWRILHLRSPPVTRTLLCLFGSPFSVNDTKARRELGYMGAVSRTAGLAEMELAFRLQVCP